MVWIVLKVQKNNIKKHKISKSRIKSTLVVILRFRPEASTARSNLELLSSANRIHYESIKIYTFCFNSWNIWITKGKFRNKLQDCEVTVCVYQGSECIYKIMRRRETNWPVPRTHIVHKLIKKKVEPISNARLFAKLSFGKLNGKPSER